jgi:hypothetical protein
MFLRFNRRFKDGKEHRYWNIVENKRCAGGKVVQRGGGRSKSEAVTALTRNNAAQESVSVTPATRRVTSWSLMVRGRAGDQVTSCRRPTG